MNQPFKHSKALVSVIMPAYKMGQFIGEALDSVGARTYPHWEVIVLDDAGPEDGMRAAVEAFAAKHADRRVEYIRHETNQGVSAARNTAMSAAEGSVLAFLDPDDHWSPVHLMDGMRMLEGKKDVGVWCSTVEAYRHDSTYRGVWRFPQWRIASFPASLACDNFIQPSAVLLRRETLELVGGFTTKPELQHVEDHDLWIRLAQAGARFEFSNRPTCFYRLHEGSAMAREGFLPKLRTAVAHEHTAFFVSMHASLLGRLLNDLEAGIKPLFGAPPVPLLVRTRIMLGALRKRICRYFVIKSRT